MAKKGQWWVRGPCGRVGGKRQGDTGRGSGEVSGLLGRAKYALIRGRAGAGSHSSKEGAVRVKEVC